MSTPKGLRAIPKDISNDHTRTYDCEALYSLISVDSLESIWDTLVQSGVSLYT